MPEQYYRYMKIMDAYWFINGLKSDQNKEHGRPTVFVKCEGHIGYIEVEIYPEGWTSEGGPEKDFKILFNGAVHKFRSHMTYILKSNTPYEIWDLCICELDELLKGCSNESY